MIHVADAFQLIIENILPFSSTEVSLIEATGRVLHEPIVADRPFPPYNRVTMDGIALNFHTFSTGLRAFSIEKVLAAGDEPYQLEGIQNAVEVMTGALLPKFTDVVVRFEDLSIANGVAKVNIDKVEQFQNIHLCGSDKPAGTLLLEKGRLLGPVELSVAASVGKSSLKVAKFPKTILISTGDELVPVDSTPKIHQIRISNSYAIFSFLKKWGIVADIIHLPDKEVDIVTKFRELLEHYELIVLSGGISAGKFDYIPKVLNEVGITTYFHKVSQRPGKPFLFAGNAQTKIFALPGNPVSTLLCVTRYLIPWLKLSFGLTDSGPQKVKLQTPVVFNPPFTCFLPVSITSNPETTIPEAIPIPINGSGDFVHLLQANGFIELPENEREFPAGRIFSFWPLT
jgi:molybdopterin molybdotransferase